ncbi:MAG: hypothetical protein AAF517_20200, partial [Planctomycetota bacterium]
MPDLSRYEWSWLPWWLYLALLAVLVPTAIGLYRRETREQSLLFRFAAISLRLSVLLIIATLLLDPRQQIEESSSEPARVLVVLDDSASMKLSPIGTGITRYDALRATLDSAAFKDLVESHSVRYAHLSESPGAALPTTGPERSTSDFDRLAPSARGFDAVLFLSDGRHNGRLDRSELPTRLSSLGVPIHTVSSTESKEIPDLSIDLVSTSPRAFVGDTLDVEIRLRLRGVEAGASEVTISDESSGSTKELQRVSIDAQDSTSYSFRVPLSRAGRRKLRVSVNARAEESVTRNNSAVFWVDVAPGSAKLLYLDRGPRWEQRFLSASWDRDEIVESSDLLISSSLQKKLPADYPSSTEELEAHDIVVFGDVGPRHFDQKQQQQLIRFVKDNGGSLILLAGPKHLPYGWRRTPFAAELFPFSLRANQPTLSDGVEAAEGGRYELTAAGESWPYGRVLQSRENNV